MAESTSGNQRSARSVPEIKLPNVPPRHSLKTSDPTPVGSAPAGSPPARSAKPTTLGDALDRAMQSHVHTSEAAAEAIGVTKDDVLAWSADLGTPGRNQHAALLEYLDVDEHELRRLILRSQMRRTQARIRG